jgi:hypothetical protein
MFFSIQGVAARGLGIPDDHQQNEPL